MDEFIKVGKVKEFIRRNDKEVIENNNELVLAHAIHIVGVVPTIFGGNGESSKHASLHILQSREAVMAYALSLSIVPMSFLEKDKLTMSNLI